MNRYGMWIFLGLAALLILMGIGTYNGQTQARINITNAWGNVQVNYQRRADLFATNFPVVVAGYNLDQKYIEAVVNQAAALSGALNQTGASTAPTGEDAAALQAKMAGFEGALKNFLVYVADNPDLISGKLFEDFMVQNEGSQNRVSVSLRDYNTAVSSYKTSVMTFPGNLLASWFGYRADDYAFFQGDEASQTAPVPTFPTPRP